MINKSIKYFLVVGVILSLVSFLRSTPTNATSIDDTGYFYVCTLDKDRTITGCSNIFYTSLGFSERGKRVRTELGGYKGWLQFTGAFQTREKAEQSETDGDWNKFPKFTLPDPLE